MSEEIEEGGREGGRAGGRKDVYFEGKDLPAAILVFYTGLTFP